MIFSYHMMGDKTHVPPHSASQHILQPNRNIIRGTEEMRQYLEIFRNWYSIQTPDNHFLIYMVNLSFHH